CREKTKVFLKEISMPNGLLPLKDIEEVGYDRESGVVWLKQKQSITHKFETIDKLVSYGTEVTAVVQTGKIKKLTGVKAKELLIWVSISDIYTEEKEKITFKSPTTLSRTFPVSAFIVPEEVEPAKEEPVKEKSSEAAEVKEARANLLVKRLKLPDTFTQVIDLVPPPETNKYTPTHILNHPEVKCRKKYSHHKDYNKAVEEESRENVKRQRSTLPPKTNLLPFSTSLIKKKEISMPNGLLPLKDIEEVELENLFMMFDIYMFQVKPALPVLRQLIYLNDEEVLTHACWALSYLSNGPNDKIQAVIQAGVCPRLVELLSHPSPTVLIPALRTVGNIVTGDDSQTLFIIDSGAPEVSSFTRMDLMSTPLTPAQIQANLDRKRAAKAAADRKRAADKKKKDKKFNAAVKERKKNTLYEKTLRMLGIKK
ncbi:unnamed protein product, partial [Brassica oleracea]